MADGRARAEWGRTSALMALVAEVKRDPKKRRAPFTPADFNPFGAADRAAGRRKNLVATGVRMRDLKKTLSRAFPDRGKKRGPPSAPGRR